jgi:hypothetical protein
VHEPDALRARLPAVGIGLEVVEVRDAGSELALGPLLVLLAERPRHAQRDPVQVFRLVEIHVVEVQCE